MTCSQIYALSSGLVRESSVWLANTAASPLNQQFRGSPLAMTTNYEMSCLMFPFHLLSQKSQNPTKLSSALLQEGKGSVNMATAALEIEG